MATGTARAYTPAGLAAASGGVVCWASGNIIVKLTTSPFLVVSFYRHLFSLPVLFVAWRLLRDRKLPWRAAGLGGVLFATHQVFHLSSLRYSTIGVVTILFSLQPILVGAASRRLVGERTTLRFYLLSCVAIAGCAIVVVASSGQPGATPRGTLLAVMNLVAWSSYYLATKRARADYGTIPWLLVMTLVSGAIIGTLALATRSSFAAPTAHEYGLFVALAIPSATLGHFLVTWAQPRIHVAASSGLILGVPIFSSIGAALFLHERFGIAQAFGAALAIAGAGLAMRYLPPPITEEAAGRFGEVAT